MRSLAFAAVFAVALLVVPSLGHAADPAPVALAVPLDPVLRRDADGGATIVAVLEDGVGGSYRYVPLKDATVDQLTSLAKEHNVRVDPALGSSEVQEIGAFVHSWTHRGVPYTTLGVYTVTDTQGLVRLPAVAIENVSGTDGMADLLAEALTHSLYPLAEASLPFVVGMTAPDSFYVLVAALLVVAIVALAPSLAVALVQGQDASEPRFNVPPEAYRALGPAAGDMSILVLAALVAGTGPGYNYPLMADRYRDYPTLRFWTVRKTALGNEAWLGAYLERTGSSSSGGDPAHRFDGTTRAEAGVAVRQNSRTTHAAGVYLQMDASKDLVDGPPARWQGEVSYIAGVAAADGTVEQHLAAVRMSEDRHHHSSSGVRNVAFLPDEQNDTLALGVYAGDEFVPLVGARTESRHREHVDSTNQGQPVTEYETTRTTSVGAFALGEYVPVAGARYWGERMPMEWMALFVAVSGLGDQTIGDFEASAGVFVLGEYEPVAAIRSDDDFAGHRYTYRQMISVGAYAGETFVPLVATTYDGEKPSSAWALDGVLYATDPNGRGRWESSTGLVALGVYYPVLGAHYYPTAYGGQGPSQESYRIGVYALDYDAFVPIAGVDYDGEKSTVVWAATTALNRAQMGPRETSWNAVAMTYLPTGERVPTLGVRYRTDAPDMAAGEETHVIVGAYVGGSFVALAGASLGLSKTPAAWANGPGTATVSAGSYLGGSYAPLARATVPPA